MNKITYRQSYKLKIKGATSLAEKRDISAESIYDIGDRSITLSIIENTFDPNYEKVQKMLSVILREGETIESITLGDIEEIEGQETEAERQERLADVIVKEEKREEAEFEKLSDHRMI